MTKNSQGQLIANRYSVRTLVSASFFIFTTLIITIPAIAGPFTIGVIEGETLKGAGNIPIYSKSAKGGKALKVSTGWPAERQIRFDKPAYKILVRGTGDVCDGSPTLEILLNGKSVITETFHDKYWRLGIQNIDLPAGTYTIGARLTNPHVTNVCRRAVYMDIVYVEEKPPEVTPDPAPDPPSGENMPAGDLPGWKQIFADDFNVDVALGDFPRAVRDKWDAYPYPWRDTKGQRTQNPEIGGWYYPEKTVSINDGMMRVWLHTEFIDNAHRRLVAAPVPRLYGSNVPGVTGQLYGRYAIRFRADMVNGYKTAWLLWPDSGIHPRDGEIDFPEGNLTEEIKGFMHWQNAIRGDQQYYALSGQSYYDWHTAVIEWEPDRVAFYLDGELMTNASNFSSEWFDKIPNTPMHWVIQTETRLDNIQPTTADQGYVEIDWVVAWERDR